MYKNINPDNSITIIKCLLIDDEQLARERLIRLLKPYNFIEVAGEAANGQEGLEMINSITPDFIFLDIEMPVLNGFEMLNQLKAQPKVVFTTAYDQYAIKAFEENSLDYLLKPIEKERLALTIEKLQKNITQAQNIPINALLEQLKPKKDIKTLTVKIGDKILLIKLSDIIAIEADEKYVFLQTYDGNRHLTDFTLSELENKLPANFIRIHRGSIINEDYIKEIRRSFNGALVFIMNSKIEFKLNSSRSYGDGLRVKFDI